MIYKSIQEMVGYTREYKRWYDIQDYTRDDMIYKSIQEMVGYTKVFQKVIIIFIKYKTAGKKNVLQLQEFL